MKDTTKMVFKFLQENDGVKMTAQDVAERTGLGVKQVNGIFTAAIQKKEYGYREAAQIEVEGEEGKTTYKDVKFLVLTDAGKAFDVDAAE